jgi:hypothetical protein
MAVNLAEIKGGRERERERERDENLKEFGFDFELRCEEWETILSLAGGIVLRERLR